MQIFNLYILVEDPAIKINWNAASAFRFRGTVSSKRLEELYHIFRRDFLRSLASYLLKKFLYRSIVNTEKEAPRLLFEGNDLRPRRRTHHDEFERRSDSNNILRQ